MITFLIIWIVGSFPLAVFVGFFINAGKGEDHPMPQTLMCMRLADMKVVHPQQDNSHKCGRCGHQLGMYPSGQSALRKDPKMEVVCQVCGMGDKFDILRPAAGGHAEMEAESLASIPVTRQ